MKFLEIVFTAKGLKRHATILKKRCIQGVSILVLMFAPILQYTSAFAAGLPTINSISPTSGPVSGGTSVVINGTNFTNKLQLTKVSVGHTHTCAISTSGKAYCWGDNTYGQLGDASTTQRNTPTPVYMSGGLYGKSFREIKAGGYHTCAITTENIAYCWGRNTMGQLGNNSTSNSNLPQAVYTAGVLSGLTINQITTSWNDTNTDGHTCAVASNQRAYCWGRNNWGQLGNNTTSTTANTVPIAVNNTVNTTNNGLYNKNVAEISAGFNLTCARSTDGTATCWGLNNSGELGTNNTTAYRYPRRLYTAGNLSGKTILKIATGGSHACAIASDQKVYCWGYNLNGQVGNNSTANQSQAQPVYTTTGSVLNGKSIASIELGGEISCAVTTDNRSACWGQGADGALGNNGTSNSLVPVSPQAGTANLTQGTVASVTVGRSTACVETTAMDIVCWGLNTYGQVGDNSTTTRTTPVLVNTTAYALKVMFGTTPAASFTYVSSTQINAVSPARIPGVVDITVTDPEGQVAALYASYTYQNPSPTISSISPTSGTTLGGTPVTINGSNFFKDKRITQTSAGGGHTCALADGAVYCWGANHYGQLGNGTTTHSNIPVAVTKSGVLNGKTVTAISAGDQHSCALADGSVYCWGLNYDGQLGNNSTTDSSVPVAVTTSGVLGGKTVTSIDAGYSYTCALATGAVYCWGYNASGQLGNNSTTNSSVPVPVTTSGVLSGKTVTSISSEYQHACALANGSVYCWGYNSHGQLGNGTTTSSSVPVAVNTATSLGGQPITAVATGDMQTCVIATGAVYCWGLNDRGQLGNNSTTNSSVPVAVTKSGVLNGKTVTSISVGQHYACALADGSVYCWGLNDRGQLGNNSTTNSSVPVAVTKSGVLNGKTVTSNSSGTWHACALTTDGIIACWGLNDLTAVGYTGGGQLGNGTNTSSTSPVASTLTSIPDILPTVSFGNLSATSVTFVSSTQLTAVTPARVAGVVDVVVTNPDNQTATSANSYTYIPPVTAPSAPTNLNTAPADNGVALTWTAPTNNGGASITDYVIEYSNNGGSTWQTFTHSPSATSSITVSGLTPGTTYTFRVSAVNSAGVGPSSATATGTPIYITVSSSSTVNLSITPTTSSRTSSTSHTVTTSTNAPSGYTLSLAMNGTNRTLANGTQNVGATTGTLTTPAALGLNSWGFRVAGVGGFGSGGATETNVATSAYTWAGVPANTAPATIKTASSPLQNDLTTVWYGMRVDMQKPSGTYSGTVIYTAVSN